MGYDPRDDSRRPIPEPAKSEVAPGRPGATAVGQAELFAAAQSRRNPLVSVLPAGAGELTTFETDLEEASPVGLSARWVFYSGVSVTARGIADFLVDVTTMNVGGDRAIGELDLEAIAYFADLGRADKVEPFLHELEQIGFLTIYGGRVDPKTGKRRQLRDAKGRPIKYRFRVRLHPPAGYRGPKSLTEGYTQFRTDRDNAYATAEASGKRVRQGNVTVRRSLVGHYENPQVSPDTGIRGQVVEADPGIRGLQVSPDTGIRGQVVEADPGIRGLQVSPDTGIRGSLQLNRSSISEREIEESIEPVPGGTAMPPATGQDERLAAEVRSVIRRLNWETWALATKRKDFTLSSDEADLIQAAMCAAISSGTITLAEATRIAQLAHGQATTIVYLVNAFGPKLGEWTRRIQAEPLESDKLPWLGKPVASPGVDHRAGVAGPERAADGASVASEGGNPHGGALSTAEAEVERLLVAGESGAERADQLLGTREWRAPERGEASALEYVQVIVPAAAREFIKARRDALLTALSADAQ